jgi:hypothetical protein
MSRHILVIAPSYFVKMDSTQKLIWLMTNEDEKILIQISKMILKSGI